MESARPLTSCSSKAQLVASASVTVSLSDKSINLTSHLTETVAASERAVLTLSTDRVTGEEGTRESERVCGRGTAIILDEEVGPSSIGLLIKKQKWVGRLTKSFLNLEF